MLSKNKPDTSLKKAFLKYFFWGMLAAWLIISLSTYISTRHEIDELYDGEMSQIAHVLLGIYDYQLFDPQADTLVTSAPFQGDENYEKKLVFQIWNGKGKLLMRSANSPIEPLASSLGVFQNKEFLGAKIRTVSIQGPEARLIVHVGQNLDIRRENATEILKFLFYILLFSFPILLYFINVGLNRGTRSLNDLSEKIALRTESDLSPVKMEEVPFEIKGIIDALNKLMSKVNAALRHERQFISDAAHELRTPLAGIKAQAQLALKDKGREQASLIRIVEGVDRTTRMANQLLTLSSIDDQQGITNTKSVDLGDLIKIVIDDLNADISQKSITIDTRIDASEIFSADKELLYILLRNLLDNAIRYSPEASKVRIVTSHTSNTLTLTIIDQGPGISEDQRKRVFDRFYRDISTDTTGSGLGLAIAQKIARLHQAEIRLATPESKQGLSVEVVFKI